MFDCAEEEARFDNMSEQPSRKRQADTQISRDGGEGSGDEGGDQPQQFVAAPPEVLAQRKILVARRPPPNADGSLATPSPFAAFLKKAAESGSVAPSPFAGGTTTAPPAASFGFGFGSGFGSAPVAASFGGFAKPEAPAPEKGFTPDAKFNFSDAVNAFTAAKKQVIEEKNAQASATKEGESGDEDEDVEKEVPIGGGSSQAAAALPAATDSVVPTGEEGETTVAQSQAKLFELLSEQGKQDGPKSWKERGCGIVKLNVAADSKARLIMREDRVKRALLNSPVDKQAFKIVTKGEGHFIFTGVNLEGKVTSYLLRFAASSGKTGADVNSSFLRAIEGLTTKT